MSGKKLGFSKALFERKLNKSCFFLQNIFHGAMSVDQLYLARPTYLNPSYSSPVRGLYLCGSGAHPGGTNIHAVFAHTLDNYPIHTYTHSLIH